MASGFLRAVLLSPRVRVGLISDNAGMVTDELLGQREVMPDIVAFPPLFLTGATLGSFLKNRRILDDALSALLDIAENCADGPAAIVPLPMELSCGVCSVAAVISGGRVVGIVPSANPMPPLTPWPAGGYEEIMLGGATVPVSPLLIFDLPAGGKFGVEVSPRLDRSPDLLSELAASGADLVVTPLSEPWLIGSHDGIERKLAARAAFAGCAVAYVNSGLGESTSSYLYRGFSAVYEGDEPLLFDIHTALAPLATSVDIDLDIVASKKKVGVTTGDAKVIRITRNAGIGRGELLRPLSRAPGLPESSVGRRSACKEAFDLSKLALCGRMEAGFERIILGLSGGLDSTMAILTAAGTMDMLGYPRSNILAVTMPGFGTSDRTYFNALRLIDILGVEGREIVIKESVMQHFADIGHDPSEKDVVYENAQARERTQILFDLANMYGGIVLGTGDLSEIMLGFSTFGGDHLAGFNCNSSLTKNMIRGIISYIADTADEPELADLLRDIVDTPVSPELLPLGDEGEIKQKTEDILGPYEVHEFFLYYTVKYGFSSEKLRLYAVKAFDGVYDAESIEKWLHEFIRRFQRSQFKRRCASEGTVLSPLAFSPDRFDFPSDLPGIIPL